MKAVFIEHFGGPEVLQYGELPDPAAAQGEVVVDVVAASVNGADWKVRSGQSTKTMYPRCPRMALARAGPKLLMMQLRRTSRKCAASSNSTLGGMSSAMLSLPT